MNDQEFLTKYLESEIIESSPELRRSCLVYALKQARVLTGRDVENGNCKNGNIRNWNWLGAICYLIIIDQIASCFIPEADCKNENGRVDHCKKFISPLRKFARKYFSADCNLMENELHAIYALRCSLAHDFGLVNRNFDLIKRHHFSLDWNNDAPLVKITDKKWNGEHTKKNDKTITEINLKKLENLVEDIHQELILRNRLDNLILYLKKEELESRFTIRGGFPFELLKEFQ